MVTYITVKNTGDQSQRTRSLLVLLKMAPDTMVKFFILLNADQ